MIGKKVRVKFHARKDWEKEPYKVLRVYLNDYVVQKDLGPQASLRTVHKDLVELWP